MKFLFDQNLSPKLAVLFSKSFKESKHLHDFSLDGANESVAWEFAKKEGFSIVIKDNDFNNLVAFFGFPPKVIWIRRGNCSTKDIEELITANIEKIKAFISDTSNGILTFY